MTAKIFSKAFSTRIIKENGNEFLYNGTGPAREIKRPMAVRGLAPLRLPFVLVASGLF
jgi:hypothetical protein